ncbi:MAG: hypothetical protein WBA23_24640 [Tunicatimonas sp.]|uniref:DUF6913 domain-containing protein n=1 Tax=Tunicatimonas sp. TaxID=1940096 RepID=UPI003C71C159
MWFFTKKIIGFQLPKLLKESSVKRQTVNYEKAERIGILITLSDHGKQNTVDDFINHFSADHKEVQVLCYDKRRAKNKIFGYLQFSDLDISAFGKFKAEHLIDFVNSRFDYLIHLDTESNEVLDKVLTLSQAKCRIGCDIPAHHSYYELMFRSETLYDLCELIMRYVRIVSTSEEEAEAS